LSSEWISPPFAIVYKDKTGIGKIPADELTKESIIEKTYYSENLPYPLFACLKTGKGYQRGEFFPFAKGGRRDLIVSVYSIMD
jgi:hypothetical protein